MKLTRWCVLDCRCCARPVGGIFRGFLNIGASITPLAGTCAWGDYDKDGDLDLAVAGADATTKYAKIYRNDAGTFIDIGASLPAVSNCALAWGDCDNDGDLDLAIAGQNLADAG